jgi:hypothetical protein
MDPNSVKFAGDVTVNAVTIRSYNGADLDIKSLVQRIDIYEDLFSPFITVDLSIVDANNIIGKLPVIGEEIVVLDIIDGTGHGMKMKPMFVYKVKDRVEISERSVSYVISLISAEAVIDMNLAISKAFSGQPADIVKDLFKGDTFDTKMNVASEPTKNKVQFIANYWNPIKIIKFLCDRSISAITNSPSYIFYESIDGFNFVSQDFLVTQPCAVKFTHSSSNERDPAHSLERIRSIYIDEEFDYISRLKQGMYGNRLLQVNPFAKSYHYRYIDFTEMHKKYSRLNPVPISTENATRRINSSLVTKNSPSSAFDKMPFDGIGQWYQQRRIELSTRVAQKKQIDVPGRFNITVGHTADVFIYSEAPSRTEDKERDIYTLLDKVHSGRHLITAVHRRITRTAGHEMFLEICKDSFMEANNNVSR